MLEVSLSEHDLDDAVRIASEAQEPSVVRLPPGHALIEAFSRQSLEEFGNVIVQAEAPGELPWRGTLGEMLALLNADPGEGLYMKHVTVSALSPDLQQRIPSALRRLNWLAALPEELRPDWYWIMAGQRETETALHVDSMASAAWNLLIEGEKAWTFLSPSTAVEQGMIPPLPVGEPVTAVAKSETYTQRPGDLLFTPSGWAHSVTNRVPALAITGNFIGHPNIDYAVAYFEATGQPDDAALCRDVRRAFQTQETQ